MLKLFDESVQFRTEELAAPVGTFQSLNHDDALELFHETLPEAIASSMVSDCSQAVRARAPSMTKELNGRRPASASMHWLFMARRSVLAS